MANDTTAFERLIGDYAPPEVGVPERKAVETEISPEDSLRQTIRNGVRSQGDNTYVSKDVHEKPEETNEDISVFRQMDYGFQQSMLGAEDVAKPDWVSAHKYLTTEHPEFAMKMGLKGVSAEKDKEAPEGFLGAVAKYVDAYKTSVTSTLVNLLGSEEQIRAWEADTYKKRFGDKWADMTPDERRATIQVEATEQLKKDFPEFYDNPQLRESGWVTAGNIGAALTSPTTLLGPAAPTYKAAATVGAGWGAYDMALLDLADRGKIEPLHVAGGAVAGAVFAPVVKATVTGAAKGTGYIFDKAAIKHRFNVSNKLIDRYEKALAEEIKTGVPKGHAMAYAKSLFGLDSKSLTQMYKITGRTRNIPKNAEHAGEYLMDLEERAGWFAKNQTINNFGHTVSKFITPVIDRVGKLSPKIAHEMRAVDFRTHLRTHGYFEQVKPWLEKMKHLSKADAKQLKIWLSIDSKETFHKAGRLMNEYAKRDPERFGTFVKDWIKVRTTLKDIGSQYKQKGYSIDLLDHFFPRTAKYPEYMSQAHAGMFHKMVSEAADKKGSALTQEELGELMRRAVMRGKREGGVVSVSGHLRSRSVDEVTEFLEPYYASPEESLHSYIRMAVNDIERVNFFQKMGLTRREKINIDKISAQTSDDIGKLAKSLKGLGAKEREDLIDILRARFTAGEDSPHRFWQGFKNLGYTLTLGNPVSAMTQLGDQAFSMFKYNIRTYAKSWITPEIITKADIGLEDALQELFANTGRTKKTLDFFMKWSGFNAMDTFGKERILNTAHQYFTKMVKTPKGREQFGAKWGRYFEDETPQLMQDLAKGHMTDNVKLLLWHELADVQPIALSEMPQKYLTIPNGRVFYMLKTFFVKQLSFLKRNIAQEAARGNYDKALRNATMFTGAWVLWNGTADALKTVLTTEEFDVADNVVENMMQMVGLNRYQTSKLAQEGPGATAYDFLMPPVPFVDNIAIAAYQGKPETAYKSIPYFGTILSKSARAKKERQKRLGVYLPSEDTRSPRQRRRQRELSTY